MTQWFREKTNESVKKLDKVVKKQARNRRFGTPRFWQSFAVRTYGGRQLSEKSANFNTKIVTDRTNISVTTAKINYVATTINNFVVTADFELTMPSNVSSYEVIFISPKGSLAVGASSGGIKSATASPKPVDTQKGKLSRSPSLRQTRENILYPILTYTMTWTRTTFITCWIAPLCRTSFWPTWPKLVLCHRHPPSCWDLSRGQHLSRTLVEEGARICRSIRS